MPLVIASPKYEVSGSQQQVCLTPVAKIETEVVRSYDGDRAEGESGYLACMEGDAVWVLSHVFPSYLTSASKRGYVWIFHGFNGSRQNEAAEGWIPVEYLEEYGNMEEDDGEEMILERLQRNRGWRQVHGVWTCLGM